MKNLHKMRSSTYFRNTYDIKFLLKDSPGLRYLAHLSALKAFTCIRVLRHYREPR